MALVMHNGTESAHTQFNALIKMTPSIDVLTIMTFSILTFKMALFIARGTA